MLFRCSVHLYLVGQLMLLVTFLLAFRSFINNLYVSACLFLFHLLQSFYFLLLYKLLSASIATQKQWSIIFFCLEMFWCNGAILPKLFKIFSVSLQTDCHPNPKASLQPVSLCICSVVREGGICYTTGSNI